jgi:nucleosome-remodeling factor subunit BPTF
LIPPPEQSKLYQTLKQGDDRRKIQQQSKLQVSLFKQKELLKKDILKKRALLEKELQIDIQVCILIMFSRNSV